MPLNSSLVASFLMALSSFAGGMPMESDFASSAAPGSGFGVPVVEDQQRLVAETYTLAYINYTYWPTNVTPSLNAIAGDIESNGGGGITVAEEKGKYGEGRILSVHGVLHHVTAAANVADHTACDADIRGTGGIHLPSMGTPWIALVKRGRCNFEEKVRHVWQYGAAGVIIYNDKDSITLDKMKIADKDRNITAVFTYRWKGEQMAQLVDQGYAVQASITEGAQCVRPLSNVNRTSVLFVSISFIVIMVISLVWLIFYYVQRFRYLQTKDKHSRRLCNVAKRIISKIPLKQIKSDDKDIDSDCCAICIEPYNESDVIRVLPCKHEFHKSCVDPWLLEHRTCPMCKMDILKHYGFVFTGSQESILQLDMDAEEDADDVPANTSRSHRGSISPMPQIRLTGTSRRSSIASVLVNGSDEVEAIVVDTWNANERRRLSSPAAVDREVCVGCITAVLKKNAATIVTVSPPPANEDDEDDDNGGSSDGESLYGAHSLPGTLKLYRGHHSKETCPQIGITLVGHRYDNHQQSGCFGNMAHSRSQDTMSGAKQRKMSSPA